MKFAWHRKPTVKGVFFDDFSQGIRGDVWRALNEKWASQNNNGYAEENCLFTTDEGEVAKAGGTGGIVAIRSEGDFAPEGRQRRGGGIVTKRLFGAGLYEVRMKVAPRAGQCSAAWTYFNDWAKEYAARRYSEIDIEMPHGGDWRKFSGTTYENYLDGAHKNSVSETVNCPPLNDGNWHVFAFEWRTDRENGDEGVVWYLDGEPVLVLKDAVPKYSATFWVASLFQDAIAWLGDPQFETAYLYIDWVRITEYCDPVLEGSAEKESMLPYTGINRKGALPENEYLADADFSRPPRRNNFKGREIVSWRTESAEIGEGKLVLRAGGSARQRVTSQYGGFSFEVSAEIESGDAEIFLACYRGAANCEEPKLFFLGNSEALALRGAEKKKTVLRIPKGETEHIEFVVHSGGGAVLRRCSLKLVSKKKGGNGE